MSNNPFTFQYGLVEIPYVNVACMRFDENLGLIYFTLIEELEDPMYLFEIFYGFQHTFLTPHGSSIMRGMRQEIVFRRCRRLCEQRRWEGITRLLDDPDNRKWVNLEIAYALRFGIRDVSKQFKDDLRKLKCFIDRGFPVEDDVETFIACSWRACPSRLEKLVKHLNQSSR